MKYSESDRCLALAGLFQAAELVQRTAHRQSIDQTAVEAILGSIFHIDTDSVAAVYAGSGSVRMGLNSLGRHLGKKPGPEELEVIRYVIKLLNLERKLVKHKELVVMLQGGIRQVKQITEPFSPGREDVINALSALYQRTISTLSPRIMVQGEPDILADPVKTNLVRALLLGGIRSALLWRQCGGNRMFLLLRRRAILQEADQLLEQAL
ncbi:MAG: high frequency lysogenization protein HflD [Gammaproteobacteria bacterium]